MKKNTQKILLSLYSKVGEVKNRVSLSALKLVVPELSDGGYRSLLHVLKNQKLIITQRLLGTTSVSITHHGTVVLEQEFPALNSKWDSWQGKWECMVFLEAPQFDKQFRYLRKLLLSEGSISVNRGVYLSPDSFSDRVLFECHNTYFSNVIIFSVANWKIASESSFIIDKYGLLDVIETYSGISRDIDRLLKTINNKKSFIYKYKNDISMVYDRVCDVLSEDPGFSMFYFKENIKVKNLILDFNLLIQQG